jgi:hypothetical protein
LQIERIDEQLVVGAQRRPSAAGIVMPRQDIAARRVADCAAERGRTADRLRLAEAFGVAPR